MQEYRATLEKLLGACRQGTLAHGYLFCGSGSSTRKAAEELACQALGTTLPRLVMHPDYGVLENVDGDTGREGIIGIDLVRELKHRLSLTSALGGYKVALVTQVQFLSSEAASALLKVLEEPAGQAVIMMTADRSSKVLSTIRSRAVCINFPPEKQLAEKDVLEKEAAALEKFFSEVAAMSYGARFKASERYAKNPKEMRSVLDYAAHLFGRELAECVTEPGPVEKSAARIRSLIRTDALLTHTNTNPRFLLDVFFMNL